jgi:hypothetical protein
MRGDEESAIGHGHENAAEAPRAYNGFSLNGNNPLNAVSHSRGAPQGHPSSPATPPYMRVRIRRFGGFS